MAIWKDGKKYKFLKNSWEKLAELNKALRKDEGTLKNRRYKCPNCGGEFDEWDRDAGYATPGTNPYKCPFCGMERGEYQKSILPFSGLLCR